jgi:hypothetical protein
MDSGPSSPTFEVRDAGDADGGVRERVRRRAAALFSPRIFLLALALSTAGVLAGNAVPLVGTLGGVAGVVGAGFLVGLVGRRAYLEVAAAGLLAVGAATLLDFLVVTLVAGPSMVAIGAGTGALAGVLGHYLGRDLRAGFTRDL